MGIFKPESLGIIFLLLLFFPLSSVLYFIICAALLWGFPHSSVGEESAYSAGDPGSVAALLYFWHVQKRLWGACLWIPAPISIPKFFCDSGFCECCFSEKQEYHTVFCFGRPRTESQLREFMCRNKKPGFLSKHLGSTRDLWLFPHFISGVKSLTVSSNDTPLQY